MKRYLMIGLVVCLLTTLPLSEAWGRGFGGGGGRGGFGGGRGGFGGGGFGGGVVDLVAVDLVGWWI